MILALSFLNIFLSYPIGNILDVFAEHLISV